MDKRAELLAPCGNFDCVKAAVNAGADAVYLGGRSFGARAYAANFDNEQLQQVCDLCHSFGVKVYVTVNTLYKDAEFRELLPFINDLYVMGVDGLIMQDLGAIKVVRTFWPDLPVHASTQLTANSLDDVKEFEAMGLKTAVLSRELSLQEIRHISANTGMRIEVFIHGALCVSYSGQCLISSVLGSRSGNRGKCAQNCRLSYELMQEKNIIAEGHLLSTKDICTLPLLPELIKAGAASLKIEGRMKSPEYVAGVTGIYRKYLDLCYSSQPYKIDPEDVLELEQLFNRGAFSKGYLQTHSGFTMMCPTHPKHWGVPAGEVISYDRKNQNALIRFDKAMVPGDGIEIRTKDEEGTGSYLNKACGEGLKASVNIQGDIRPKQAVYRTYDKRLMDKLKGAYETITRKVPLDAVALIRSGEPAELTFHSDEFSAHVSGAVPTAAQNQPLSIESVSAQIGKLGNTIYKARSIRVDLEDGLYLNKSDLNTLKNHAAELLRKITVNSFKRVSEKIESDTNIKEKFAGKKTLSVLVCKGEQFEAALLSPSVSMIYLDLVSFPMENLKEICTKAHEYQKKIAVKLPRIWREYIRQNVSERFEECLSSEIDGFLISNSGHYHAVKDSGKSFYLDFTGNVLNSRSFAFWKERGAESVALSVEMSRDEINALPDHSCTEILAYGYIPLMVTHQCPIGNYAGKKYDHIHCEKYGHSQPYSLRCGKESFRLETDCKNCLCTITTSRPLDFREDLENFKVKTFRLNLTHENFEKTEQILKKYEQILKAENSEKSAAPNIYDKLIL